MSPSSSSTNPIPDPTTTFVDPVNPPSERSSSSPSPFPTALSPPYRKGLDFRKCSSYLYPLENISVGLTALTLIFSICIVATSGNALEVFHHTTLGPDFGLPLWPQDFTIKPTVALVACGAVILAASFVSLYTTGICTYHAKLRARPIILSSIMYASALSSLIASLTAVGIFYRADHSDTTWSLQSWSCQWKDVSMSVPPHWDDLCSESKAALYLTIVIVPLQILCLGGIALGAKKREMRGQSQERFEEEQVREKIGSASS